MIGQGLTVMGIGLVIGSGAVGLGVLVKRL